MTVCHFPPGTSKWNKIEHRLFGCHYPKRLKVSDVELAAVNLSGDEFTPTGTTLLVRVLKNDGPT